LIKSHYLAPRVLTAALLSTLALAMHTARAEDDAAVLLSRFEGPQASGSSELDRLDLPALMARLQVPGASVAVIRDFKLHWAKGYGVADADSGRPVDTATRFQAASISKPVTAMAVMRLVQERRLDLDADIHSVLTSWRVPRTEASGPQAVTARSLLSHTSGADDGFGFPGYAPQLALPTVRQILQGDPRSNVGKVVFARPPYSASKYSGGGLLIMQQALTDLSGRPFAQFMQTAVLAPLGMARSSFEQPPAAAEQANSALAHDKQGRRMAVPWHVYPEQAAAGLWTTPTDLAKFIIEMQSALQGPKGTVLERRSAAEMVTPVGVGRYAVGLAISQRGEGWYFTHSGDNLGYRAWISGHVRKGYGVVIMVNGENGMALMNQIAERVERAYGWDSLEK